MRGLIYEDTPQSIRGSGETVVLDHRVALLELSLKELDRRIRETETDIAALRRKKTLH